MGTVSLDPNEQKLSMRGFGDSNLFIVHYLPSPFRLNKPYLVSVTVDANFNAAMQVQYRHEGDIKSSEIFAMKKGQQTLHFAETPTTATWHAIALLIYNEIPAFSYDVKLVEIVAVK